MNKNNPIRIAAELGEISLEEIISELGLKENLVRELDANPQAASYELLKNLYNLTGVSIDRLTPKPKISGPVIKPFYEVETADFKELIEEKRKSCERLKEKYEDLEDAEVAGLLDEILSTYNNVAQNALDNIKKPVVCAFGKSDTGKSTLINYFLGEEVAKTDYSPLTSTVVYYEHRKDMPEFLRNNQGHNAFVFGKKTSDIKKKNKQEFEHEDVKNPKKAKKYLISSGDFETIINEYSSRKGNNFQTKEYTIFEIVVYLDNDILKELSFIDIPGFSSGLESDNVGIARKMYCVDILFYLMTANGFMQEIDQLNLQMMLKGRTSLDGVYILSTQADIIGSPVENRKRLDSGYDIFMKCLTERQMEKFDPNKLRSCFYAFDTGNAVYCRKLNTAIESEIPMMIGEKITRAKAELEAVCDELNDRYRREKLQILEGRSFEKKSKQAEELFITERKQELRTYRAELLNEIEEYRKSSMSEFELAYDEFMTEEHLISLMEKKKLKNKKEEIQNFSAYLSNEIGDRLSEILGQKSERFANLINEIIENYEESWNQGWKSKKFGIDFSGFDFKRAFAAGLTGVGTYGALAVWAAIAASGSNLGAYILVAKVVSALSAIGISVGGTSSAIAAVAAMGGPITLGVAIAAMAAVLVFGLFSGNWKKRLAKELIKTYKKEECKEKNLRQINQHWDDTGIAMKECLHSLEENLLEYYKKCNAIQDRIQNHDQELYETIRYIYDTVCQIYWDLRFKISVDEKRIGNTFFLDRKKELEDEINNFKRQKLKYTLASDVHEMEGLVFLSPEELQLFWKDLRDILNDTLESVIALTDATYFVQREKAYSIYYKKIGKQISIRYIDAYPYLKENYENYKELILNSYLLKDDQIRYKVFDMLEMAEKEILIIMPWINSYGWESVGNYGKSLKEIFEKILETKKALSIKILVGYDLQHKDTERERKTVEMAKQILNEFRLYEERFKIYTEIGTHEKIVTIDNVCSLDGSYNLLSNDAPYGEKLWAGESMNVFENPYNVERHRREILERAGLPWAAFEN